MEKMESYSDINLESSPSRQQQHLAALTVRPVVLGRRGDSSANGFVDGKIGEFQFYNRELTMEVLQNYNAKKSKYGY